MVVGNKVKKLLLVSCWVAGWLVGAPTVTVAQAVSVTSVALATRQSLTSPNQALVSLLPEEARARQDQQVAVTIAYQDLQVGERYEAEVLLLDPSSQRPYEVAGQGLRQRQSFTAKETQGSLTITFHFDGRFLAGKQLVAYQRIWHQERLVVAKTDRNSLENTISYPKLTVASPTPSVASRQVGEFLQLSNLISGREYQVRTYLKTADHRHYLYWGGLPLEARRSFTATGREQQLQQLVLLPQQLYRSYPTVAVITELRDATGKLLGEASSLKTLQGEPEGEAALVWVPALLTPQVSPVDSKLEPSLVPLPDPQVSQQVSRQGRLLIQRQDAVTGALLPGAIFQLTDLKEQKSQLLITDETGVAQVSGLQSGTYLLTERQAPTGYESPKQQWQLEIKADP